jgi:hypothetical protein
MLRIAPQDEGSAPLGSRYDGSYKKVFLRIGLPAIWAYRRETISALGSSGRQIGDHFDDLSFGDFGLAVCPASDSLQQNTIHQIQSTRKKMSVFIPLDVGSRLAPFGFRSWPGLTRPSTQRRLRDESQRRHRWWQRLQGQLFGPRSSLSVILCAETRQWPGQARP